MQLDEGFSGQVAVVTGGAGGIGRAVVDALLQAGARVAVLDRVVAGVVTGDGPLGVETDVTDVASVDRAVEQVREALGPVSLLVTAAGVVSEHELEQLGPDEWRRVVDVSLTGTYLAARAVVPAMQRQRRGAVVAFSSGYATSGYRYGGHYAAAKAGVEAFVKSLALEAARDGVRVNAVAPGPVFTPFLGHIEDREAWRRDREARIPMGRIADPVDVVGPVMFLLGPGSAYMTGQVLHVNGGLLMP